MKWGKSLAMMNNKKAVAFPTLWGCGFKPVDSRLSSFQ